MAFVRDRLAGAPPAPWWRVRRVVCLTRGASLTAAVDERTINPPERELQVEWVIGADVGGGLLRDRAFYVHFDDPRRTRSAKVRCYLDAGVIAYSRPFTQTTGIPLLSFKKIGLRPTPRQTDLHEQLLRYRHKVVAHSDVDHMRIAVRSFSPFDDRSDIRMPMIRTDEGLPFLDDRWAIIEWLRLLMSKLGKTTFALAQADAPLAFTKDYLVTSDGG